jgi:hypothetical protein
LVFDSKALFASAGALTAAMSGQFKPILEWSGLSEIGRQVAAAILTIAILGAVTLLFWRAYRRYARESRLEKPEKFTLVATTPESLIGRTEDLERLLRAVTRNRIVLLDGGSGAGKSALVGSGLAPRLHAGHVLLPILVRDWGDDWIRGPLAATLDALYSALSEEQRTQIEWTASPDLAGKPPALVAELTKRAANPPLDHCRPI